MQNLNSLVFKYFYENTKLLVDNWRKLSKFKNNFIYKNEFKTAFNKLKVANTKGKIVSSDLVSKSGGTISKPRKQLSSLQYKGEILFGTHPVYLALLQKKRKIYQLFIKSDEGLKKDIEEDKIIRKKEILKMAASFDIVVRNINSQGFKYISPGTVHQGGCLDVGPLPFLEWNEDESREDKSMPLWLVLDEIIDPMNVGAIIRSAYYFGVKKLFIVRGNSCKLSPIVSKASSGALEIMDIYQIENLEYFIKVMKSKNWTVVSTVAYCDDKTESVCPIDVSKFTLNSPTILLLGNEGRGIETSIKVLCDTFLSIYPSQNLHEGIDSLNVSVATGVILHMLLKSWKDALK